MTSNPIKNINNSLATNVNSNSIHQRGLSALANIEMPLTVAEKLYQEGLLHEEDEEYEKAFNCFNAAADLEHAPSYLKLADFYRGGLGIIQSKENWLLNLKKACDLNHPHALYEYGFRLLEAYSSTKQDKEIGFEFIKKSAELGSFDAMQLIAYCYYKGIGTPVDKLSAIRWCDAAINLRAFKAKKLLSEFVFEDDKKQSFVLLEEFVDGYDRRFKDSSDKRLWLARLELVICYIYAIGSSESLDKAKYHIEICSNLYNSLSPDIYLTRWFPAYEVDVEEKTCTRLILMLRKYDINLTDFFEKIEQLGFKHAKKLSAFTLLFGDFEGVYSIEEIISFRKTGIQQVKDNKDEFAENNFECLDKLYSRCWETQEIEKQFLILCANLGIALAQFQLAECYSYSDGELFEQDVKKAFIWYEKAAEQDHAEAQDNLGLCYYHGHGVEQDYEKAVHWFEKAAEQDHAEAQDNLGLCYYHGHGVEQDYEKAVHWFEKAAEQGYARAQNNLGNCFNNGHGVTQDYSKAVYWYEKAAEQDHAEAQDNLGLCFYHGHGVEQDYEKAVHWFEKAAEQDLDAAFYNLGHCYENALGVDESPELAAKYYRKGAEEEQVYAQYKLGLCYANGYGVDEDMLQCAFWIKKAADQGYEDAVQYLAELDDSIG